MTREEVVSELKKIQHPAINYSLIKLGILKDIDLKDNTVSLTFAFPFPNIPIADTLISMVSDVLQSKHLKLKYKTRVMSEEERTTFLRLENEAWRG